MSFPFDYHYASTTLTFNYITDSYKSQNFVQFEFCVCNLFNTFCIHSFTICRRNSSSSKSETTTMVLRNDVIVTYTVQLNVTILV